MQWASTHTPAEARIALYGEPRGFYLNRDYFWADDPHNNLIDYAKVRSGADLVSALRALGATHVLWNRTPGENGGAFGPPAQITEAIDRGLLMPLYESRGYTLYRIGESPGNRADATSQGGAQ